MTKATPMNQRTALEITARLQEIASEQAAFDARDFDAELGEVMRQGGDVDALENTQLEAERQARRLRVERSALESALPEAKAREGADALAAIEVEYDALTEQAQAAKAAIIKKWAALSDALTTWRDVGQQADELTRRAEKTAKAGGLRSIDKKIGLYRSAQLTSVSTAAREALQRFNTERQSIRGEYGVGGVNLDA
ncbi:MAG: hypothetical protein VX229_07495 [Pseudomonadota bacterium]|nr:hypothetical protein [Pseudomonadota bacterium]